MYPYDMEDFPGMLYGWSWEENKRFELALAVVDEEDPDRWEVVSSMIGGTKSPEDVRRHYVVLLEDLECIESGELDHKLLLLGEEGDRGRGREGGEETRIHQSQCWSEDDHKLMVQLKIN